MSVRQTIQNGVSCLKDGHLMPPERPRIDVLPSLAVLSLDTNNVATALIVMRASTLCVQAWERRVVLGSPGYGWWGGGSWLCFNHLAVRCQVLTYSRLLFSLSPSLSTHLPPLSMLCLYIGISLVYRWLRRESVKKVVCCFVEEKKVKRKHVESLFRIAVSNLPDAALSSELITHADKYVAYLRR